MTLEFLVLGFPASPHSLTPPIQTPPFLSIPPPFCTDTLHLMPINDSFMWLLWACSDVCPIDLLTLLQASEPRSPVSQ